MVTLLHDTRRAVPFSVFNEGKAGEVFDEVKHSGARVVMKNDTAECVLMSPEYYEKFMDDYNDMKLLALAIERWERGYSTPSNYYMLKLSEVFAKPIEYFMKGDATEIKERSITMNKGVLVFELGSQRLEVPATAEFSQQFWERVDKMIEKIPPHE